MENDQTTQETFAALKAILEPFASRLVVVKDGPDGYYLDTTHIMKSKKPLSFGAVTIGKNYISFHLVPIYFFTDLLEGMSKGLRARKQGKACFNFKQSDPELFEELAKLTQAGYERFHSEGSLEAI